jgi:hypothetical protein
MLPHQLFFSSCSIAVAAVPGPDSHGTLKVIPLWFAGGDQPPFLVRGIILNEAILPTDDLKPCLSKFTFNLLG